MEATHSEGWSPMAYEEESGISFILQLVAPGQFRQQIIHKLHRGTIGGHLGTEKTHSRVRECFLLAGVLE